MSRATIQRPIALSGAPVPGAVTEKVGAACDAARPYAGVVLGATLGAVAAYIVPKVLDQALERFPAFGSRSPEVEFEVED